jgi:hypothetical protein
VAKKQAVMHVRCAHRQALREISARIVCRCTQSKLRASATSSYNTRRDNQVLGWGVAVLDTERMRGQNK